MNMMEVLEGRRLLSLTVDVRLPGGGKSIEVDSVGNVVNMELWAVVTGSDATVNEGFQAVQGSLLSSNTNGGSTRGTLIAQLATAFISPGSQDSDEPTGATAATVDLDADGDLDIGSNVDSDAAGFLIPRAGTMRFSSGTSIPNGREWKLADLTYTVTQLKNPAGITHINFRRRESIYAGLWIEDQSQQRTYSDGILSSGQPVEITIPEPPVASLVSAPGLTAGGSGPYSFTVTYSDNDGLNLASINTGDVRIAGPNGFSQLANLVLLVPTPSSSSYTATYQLPAPGGLWSDLHNGDYEIWLEPQQVSDVAGHFSYPAKLGSFQVSVPRPDTSPPRVLSMTWDNENRQAVIAMLNEELGASLAASDLRLRNLSTAADYTAAAVSVSPGDTPLITWTIASPLPDGLYRAGIPAAKVSDKAGNCMISDALFEFRVFAGDADGNGRIDIDDYYRTDLGYARRRTGFSNGDFNRSAFVDADDYLLIDQAFIRQSLALAVTAPQPFAVAAVPVAQKQDIIADRAGAFLADDIVTI